MSTIATTGVLWALRASASAAAAVFLAFSSEMGAPYGGVPCANAADVYNANIKTPPHLKTDCSSMADPPSDCDACSVRASRGTRGDSLAPPPAPCRDRATAHAHTPPNK